MSSVSVKDLLGCKFTAHGRNKEEGFDCYGLAIEVLKRAGITLKDVFYDDIKTAKKNEIEAQIVSKKIDKPEEMCIIVIRVNHEPRHIGVYLGEGLFIHATENFGVTIERLSKYTCRIEGYYKVCNN